MSEFFFEIESWFEDNDESVVFVTLHGQGRRVINHGSDTVYKVFGGLGTFEIDGEYIDVEAGDAVRVPHGSEYEDFGVFLQMVATSTPPYDSSTVDILDDPEETDI